ncbi:MAG: NAD(P)/FAD-dependent oxidoreductase [Bacilli bacterium]|nr:NAD(P)/FAD-dependent oxidoreductase [Erysipelotrichia bacterium]
MKDVIVIGAGVIGALLARELAKYELDVLVIDKESDVGNETTMANSAIIHSGYDPKPGTLKARFNVLGNQMFPKLCEELDVDLKNNGSLTIALSEEEIPALLKLRKIALLNGVKVELLTPIEVFEKEPLLSKDVQGALFAPTAMIVDPFNLVAHALENAVDNGVILHLNEEVKNIQFIKEKNHYEVMTSNNTYQSKVILNAAGLYSDKIAKMVDEIDFEITPRKGEYLILDHFDQYLEKRFLTHTIFPMPSKKGKGILLSPTTSGNYIVGPSSHFVSDRSDFSTSKETISEVQLAAKKLIPSVPFKEVIRTFSGLRASSTRGDFIIEPLKNHPSFINLAGIDSPGLAASPAIADYVVNDLVKGLLTLKVKKDFNPYVRKYPRLKKMSVRERNELIKKDAAFGRIICNCEKVTLGELNDLMSRSLPILSVKAIKKRLRIGFGKCQGGFCQPFIVKYLSNYYNIDISEVKYDKVGSNIIKCSTKGCRL